MLQETRKDGAAVGRDERSDGDTRERARRTDLDSQPKEASQARIAARARE